MKPLRKVHLSADYQTDAENSLAGPALTETTLLTPNRLRGDGGGRTEQQDYRFDKMESN